jgi:hypothetical protein
MRVKASLVVFLLLFAFLVTAQAQQETSAAESAENLRLQLLEVQAREEGLRARAEQLDEALKPENIERSLAGVGSTRPEELRETRRRQLQIERDGVAAQLKVLESSRTRLEAAIVDADARAYQQSALTASPQNRMVVTQLPWSTPLLVSGSAGFVVAGLVAGFFVRRRLRRKL